MGASTPAQVHEVVHPRTAGGVAARQSLAVAPAPSDPGDDLAARVLEGGRDLVVAESLHRAQVDGVEPAFVELDARCDLGRLDEWRVAAAPAVVVEIDDACRQLA